MLDLQRIDHNALTVRDIPRAEAFYTRIGFQIVLKIPRATFIRNNDAILALFPANEGATDAKARGSMDRDRVAIQHLAFRVAEGSLEGCKEKLEAAEIPVRGPIDHEINRSIYFEDPDGHQLELTHPI
jgi:catechol-2,3-dioxygenase